MSPTSTQLILASRSPRRFDLLRQLGLRFETRAADVSEVPARDQLPEDFALATATAKARAVFELRHAEEAPSLPVVGADTDVAVDGEILGKPTDRDDALAMLERLSDRSHRVYSAVAVIFADTRTDEIRCETGLSVTQVNFGVISAGEAEAYWASGEPVDKAGAYAIQGHAARWVRELHGSYSGVVGLPLYETVQLLERCGITVPPPGAYQPTLA